MLLDHHLINHVFILTFNILIIKNTRKGESKLINKAIQIIIINNIKNIQIINYRIFMNFNYLKYNKPSTESYNNSCWRAIR